MSFMLRWKETCNETYSTIGTIFQLALPAVIEDNETKYLFFWWFCLFSLTIYETIIWHCKEKLHILLFLGNWSENNAIYYWTLSRLRQFFPNWVVHVTLSQTIFFSVDLWSGKVTLRVLNVGSDCTISLAQVSW